MFIEHIHFEALRSGRRSGPRSPVETDFALRYENHKITQTKAILGNERRAFFGLGHGLHASQHDQRSARAIIAAEDDCRAGLQRAICWVEGRCIPSGWPFEGMP